MKGEPGEGPMHEKKESPSYERAETKREYGGAKDMNASGYCKTNCQYPTGTITSTKLSLGAQKNNPARRNRNY